MRIERVAHGAAELDADPGHRMRIVDVEAEHERARQADDAHEPQRRDDADARHRPEIGDDLGNPALPQLPGLALAGAPRCRPCSTGRSEFTRSSSAAAWCPTSCTSEEAMPVPTMRSRGTRMIATGFSPPPGMRVRARRMAAPMPRSR